MESLFVFEWATPDVEVDRDRPRLTVMMLLLQLGDVGAYCVGDELRQRVRRIDGFHALDGRPGAQLQRTRDLGAERLLHASTPRAIRCSSTAV